MRKIKRFFAALLLLPACYGATAALWQFLKPFKDVPEGSFYFFTGIAGYFAFQWACFRPLRTYVFGHELTHALAAWLSGARVRRFRVGRHGGSVTVSRSNFFVSLSPYMLPLYSFILLGLYYGAVWLYPALAAYGRVFLWALGVSFGFHMALTVYALQQGQPDLRPTGRLLSAVIIYLGNVLAIVAVFGALFPQSTSWRSFARTMGLGTATAVERVSRGTVIVLKTAAEKLDEPRAGN